MTFFFQTNTIRVILRKKKCPGSSELYNGGECPLLFLAPSKCIKVLHTKGLWGVNKGLLK